MIGQNKLISQFSELAHKDKFPRFSIIVGQTGSGKKTLAKEVVDSWNSWDAVEYVQLGDVKVDTIRDMITEAYKVPYKYVYVIPDADNMSLAAKNALLKVTEEPPNNAYFIMTLQDESNTLATIKSRGTIFRMEPYSAQDIGDYYTQTYDANLDDIILDVCEVPGDVDIMKSVGAIKFYDYVKMVVDNIAEVSGANSFKIADKIALKDEEGKYDIRLFWRLFTKVCLDEIKSDPLKYANGIKITSKYLQELKITGISKPAMFDAWILDIREAWM